jgi:3-methyladenine DNA glycosylase AlkD
MDVTADSFVGRLTALGSPVDVEKARRWFRTDAEFVGARMGAVFALAKEYVDMPLSEIDKLLDSPVHEARVGAVSIMGKQAMRKKTSQHRKEELYELYLSRTDLINTWDLVDVSAHQVIGGYLLDKPRDVLYRLARSENWWERRIAMFSTLAFIRAGDVGETFELAEILVDDDHDLVRKVVGGMLREAGKKDRARLLDFLDRHAATMPRTTLRQAIEHLDKKQRRHYLNQQ